jgi:hypothetical protein
MLKPKQPRSEWLKGVSRTKDKDLDSVFEEDELEAAEGIQDALMDDESSEEAEDEDEQWEQYQLQQVASGDSGGSTGRTQDREYLSRLNLLGGASSSSSSSYVKRESHFLPRPKLNISLNTAPNPLRDDRKTRDHHSREGSQDDER